MQLHLTLFMNFLSAFIEVLHDMSFEMNKNTMTDLVGQSLEMPTMLL